MSTKYEESYQLTHDIDWFCRIGDTAMHFASNGGLLPKKVNNREANRQIQHDVAMLDAMITNAEQIEINIDYVNERLGENVNPEAFKRYVESFVAMAKKGFVSFDRMLDEDGYIWIAKPTIDVAVNIENLPLYEKSIFGLYDDDRNMVHVECLNQE